MSVAAPLSFPSPLEQFFLERLMQQLHASPRTIAAYRDTFRLLLVFAHRRLGNRPADVALDDLDAPFVLAFLKHLEEDRHIGIRSRNARHAAVRAFMHFVAFKEPSAGLAQRVLAIPMRRFERPLIGFLTRPQVEAILSAPDATTWTGRRERIMLTLIYNTSARVSELVGTRWDDLTLDPTASIRIRGKGCKERAVPLWPDTRALLGRWLREGTSAPKAPLFPSRSGGTLTRVSVAERLALAVKAVSRQHPELARRRVSPHVLRHSLAMHMCCTVRRRHHCHRLVARPREPGDHSPVRRSGSRYEDHGLAFAVDAGHAVASLPTVRSSSGVPAAPVIMHGVLGGAATGEHRAFSRTNQGQGLGGTCPGCNDNRT